MSGSFGDYDPDLEAHTYQLVEELGLEAPSPEQNEVLGTRIRVPIAISPGNVCDRGDESIRAETIEFRKRSLTCIARRPVPVGSVFFVSFDPERFPHASVHAICKRCAMLTDTAFEAKFSTFEDLDAVTADAEEAEETESPHE